MKLRFNAYDIVCGVTELQSLVGLRVNQVYDIDNKTYLIRLQGNEKKVVLLLESGIRFHTTAFEWPKNSTPNGFSMKLRKHLKNKRLEKLYQIGADRIIDFQFGIGDAAYHIIIELYDKGNIILTDYDYIILYLLRPHTEGEDIHIALRKKYPLERAKTLASLPTIEELRHILSKVQSGDNLRSILMPLTDCGPTVIQHALTKYKLNDCIIVSAANDTCKNEDKVDIHDEKIGVRKKKKRALHNMTNCHPFDFDRDLDALMDALKETYRMLSDAKQYVSKGFIIQKKEEKSVDNEGSKYFYHNIEYQPFLFEQYCHEPIVTFDSFMLAVDEFYSTLEGQKIDLKTLQQERDALKKLTNVKKDHAKRLEDLNKIQEIDKRKAELITSNQSLIDSALSVIRSAIASQMSWIDIQAMVTSAQELCDPVACAIKQLKFEINHITMNLSDPYADDSRDNIVENHNINEDKIAVDIDLDLSALANARKYFSHKKISALKEQKTIDASEKALKSAEKKTQQTLKDVRTISTISKVRKVYWFEKFYWFISSENYLVIGGRDAHQNELIVKRYMRTNDIYVHAEIPGATSVIIRNITNDEIPPKTLVEAGTMAVSYSKSWEAKVATNAYWVYSHQVNKTAPTGEYLTKGSFMIRGKKNFLLSCHLIMGLSLLFKLEDSFIDKHRGERKVRNFEESMIQDENEMLKIENEVLEVLHESDEILNEQSVDEKQQFKEEEFRDRSDGDYDLSYFPDTHVKIEHDTGRITICNEQKIHLKNNENIDTLATAFRDIVNGKESKEEEEETTITMSMPTRIKQQQNSKKRNSEKERKMSSHKQNQNTQNSNINMVNQNISHNVRGQKGKLKRMKSKYKGQDEEERKLRMEILKPAVGISTVIKHNEELNEINNIKLKKGKEFNECMKISAKDRYDDECDNVPISADIDILDSLTGQPYESDELLFVIPIVAPYQALQNYKYKLKLTPGTGKRGRVAKTALSIFSKDKQSTRREKDLLKSIKEESLARNIPGKVKLSAPQLQKYKK